MLLQKLHPTEDTPHHSHLSIIILAPFGIFQLSLREGKLHLSPLAGQRPHPQLSWQ
jgi:hypothetical protein